MTVDLVIPTIGRRSLLDLLCALGEQPGPLPDNIYLVDDRRHPDRPLIERGLDVGRLNGRLHVLPSGGRGPAAARNAGWKMSRAEWVVFLDDDVCPAGDWLEQLDIDLAGINLPVAASQGQLRVPLPNGRPPTDWERNVAGLEGARWITADMAYRRSVLEELGGFDERFKRAFREDAELALRVTQGGYRIVDGSRCVEHPVRPASPWISVRAQAGGVQRDGVDCRETLGEPHACDRGIDTEAGQSRALDRGDRASGQRRERLTTQVEFVLTREL